MCSNFTATVNISQVIGFDSGSYDISYDPDILEVTGVTDGSIGGTAIPVTDWGFIPPGIQGTVRIINNVGGTGGVSGVGTLAVIDFSVNCTNCGNSTISFTGEDVVYDNQSREINSAWSGNWTNVSCATPTPSPTATTTATATLTATATTTPTVTPTATSTVFMPWVHFNATSYNVTANNFLRTWVELDPSDMVSNISYFWGIQFDVEYDYNLITARIAAAQPGSLYDVINGSWDQADAWSVARVGSGPNDEGLIRVLVDWRDYPPLHNSEGITTNGGTLINLRWRATANTGVSDLIFREFKALVGYGPDGADPMVWEITPVLWTNSSVTVQ